jgi:hypothetical protein
MKRSELKSLIKTMLVEEGLFSRKPKKYNALIDWAQTEDASKIYHYKEPTDNFNKLKNKMKRAHAIYMKFRGKITIDTYNGDYFKNHPIKEYNGKVRGNQDGSEEDVNYTAEWLKKYWARFGSPFNIIPLEVTKDLVDIQRNAQDKGWFDYAVAVKVEGESN